jgi:hypothetical protein
MIDIQIRLTVNDWPLAMQEFISAFLQEVPQAVHSEIKPLPEIQALPCPTSRAVSCCLPSRLTLGRCRPPKQDSAVHVVLSCSGV